MKKILKAAIALCLSTLSLSLLSMAQDREPSSEIFRPDVGYTMHGEELPDTTINYIGLHQMDNGMYQLISTRVSLQRQFNDCTHDSSISLVPECGNILFLFSGPIPLQKGILPAILDTAFEMWPGSNYRFTFGEAAYELRATGKYSDQDICDYKLYYCSDNDTQLLVQLDQIEGTTATILFIGDLDGDGKPDIILDAKHHYEFSAIILFLSSEATGIGELLRPAASRNDWFDC